jgi:endonuclease/exonuclease/phosphatase family metal-dependent hydrolase
MRIATWNLQRKRPASPNGRIAVDYLGSVSADIAVLTEAWVDHLSSDFQHADAGPTGIAHLSEGERKVVVASRWPINSVRIDLDVPTAGRFVSAVIETPEGSLTVIGICIPWFASRVRSGEAENWEDHCAFLRALSPVLREAVQSPCLVAGDFNQRIPRSRQPGEVAELLEGAFKDFTIPTAGERPETGRQLIDHIAISPDLECENVSSWSGETDGKKMSDHDGVSVEISFTDP